MSMAVTVRNNKSLQEALEQFVKGELLSNDNAYFCEKCQKKVDAIKRTVIKTLPSTLVVQLKRFEFDWDNNRPIKFNDHFSFPLELDMEPFTVEGLAKRDAEQRMASQQQPQSGSAEPVGETEGEVSKAVVDQPPPIEAANAPGSYMYQLSGVVVHQGVANAGHYYSFIRILDTASPAYGKWLKFNDHEVEEVYLNDAMMEKEFFGGKYWAESQVSSYSTETERYWNAYMLFYERVQPAAAVSADVPFVLCSIVVCFNPFEVSRHQANFRTSRKSVTTSLAQNPHTVRHRTCSLGSRASPWFALHEAIVICSDVCRTPVPSNPACHSPFSAS
jgi:ubiquitin carboxyl-terminal hydrolase 9/24